ncbi:MAG: outer membrane beta-barrel protein [Crocinitomicaceae bacterium]|nr:outer membrane beta-barrel protein [Crocinitomicaceae bacterium]
MKTYTITFVLFIICFLFSHGVKAQESVEISGQVKDEQTKENLPYCKVVALNDKDSIVRGGITDDKGFFRLPLVPGQYKLIISYYGYVSDTIKTDPFQEDYFLGVFKLKSSVLDIGEVKVEASSRIDMLEKDVQIITDREKNGSTAAKDVLDKIAGISYDDYTGTLKVDNDANIMVLVNGVEKSQEYVQNLDPERLIRVETIRDPGGRYGLEGYTAIVNVVLKRDYQGSELYIEQMQLVDVVPEYSRLDYMIGSLGATYNFTRNDLNIYGSAWMERRKFLIPSESITEYGNGILVEEKPETGLPNAIILEADADYTFGFDYRINPKHIISFESNLEVLPQRFNEESVNNRTSVYSNGSLLEEYGFVSQITTKTLNSYNSLFYIADFNKRTKLNVNFTYSNYRDDYVNYTNQDGFYNREETGVNRKQYTRGYAELDYMLSKGMSLQFGYGNTWRELKNEYSISVTEQNTGTITNLSDEFALTDMRHKIYSNFSWKMGKKWSSRIGLATETSSPRVDGQQLNYIIYQPMFDLRYVPNKKLNFVLKYRTSSDYPSIAETNPFTSLVNPRITSTGNPFLTPSTTHRFSLRMNILQGLLAVEPYSQYSTNMVVKVGELDANNMFNFRFENAQSYQRNGAKLNFSKFMKPGIIIQANMEAYHAKIVSTTKTNSLMDWRGDVNLVYMFTKSQTMLGVKYQRQQSKMISGLGYDKGDVDFWMLFYKQPLLKKRASVMFGYFLPLNLGASYNQGFHAETNGISMHTDIDVSLIKNMFLLEFSFRLSKGKSIKKRDKDLEQESEESGGGMF